MTIPVHVAGGELLAWSLLEVLGRSWISLATAPFVLIGYRLLGRRRRVGWWFVIASQVGLLAIALVDRQYGLLVVVVLMCQAFRNWQRWGQAEGARA